MITQHAYSGDGSPCNYEFPDGFTCNAGPGNHLVGEVAAETYSNGILPKMSQGETAFAAYAEAVQKLIRSKDAAYGGAWQRQGYMGNLARIMSKAARLENMMWRDDGYTDATDEDESVMDTLKDLMALAAFMAANIEDGNRWGHGK